MYIYSSKTPQPTVMTTKTRLSLDEGVERVLIIYIWAETDRSSLGNLEFFVRHGIHPSQPADYYFVLKKVGDKIVNKSRLPTLPSNAHYIQHESECSNFGTFGWFLSKNITDINLYKYFIFMNGSIRGPFLITFFYENNVWWYTVFTTRLNNEVKLVGPTISCKPKVHVQGYLMATDRIGFDLFTNSQNGIFHCHDRKHGGVFDSEITASQLLLQANYQIASLQMKYEGWDFRKKQTKHCNYLANIGFRDKTTGSISHDPYELVFVLNEGASSLDSEFEQRARLHQRWRIEPVANKEQRFYEYKMNTIFILYLLFIYI